MTSRANDHRSLFILTKPSFSPPGHVLDYIFPTRLYLGVSEFGQWDINVMMNTSSRPDPLKPPKAMLPLFPYLLARFRDPEGIPRPSGMAEPQDQTNHKNLGPGRTMKEQGQWGGNHQQRVEKIFQNKEYKLYQSKNCTRQSRTGKENFIQGCCNGEEKPELSLAQLHWNDLWERL